jgi:1-acyl-sn-glycerol-3-phosphate acyltransferase
MPELPPPKGRIVRAHKHGWPKLAVEAMARRKIQGAFTALRVAGRRELETALDADPSGCVLLANHSTWWDVFLVVHLIATLRADGYGMMEHFNLTRFRFFRRIGAFSVDRTDPASLRESLDYTLELLARPRATVWIFPQGKIAPNDARPLAFQPGLRALLTRAGRLRIAPVAIRPEFWQEERPELLVRIGAPRWVEKDQRATLLEDWQRILTDELDALRDDALAQDPTRFESLLRGPLSINERYGRLRARFRGKTPGAPDDY